jgi:hypothetical protein
MPFVHAPIKSTAHPNLQAELHYDPHPSKPELLGHITYNSRARHVLGTKPLDAEQDAAIAEGVLKGKLIGLPVWAYVHGSVAIRAAYQNPFGCPWDSGRSGWVYIEAAAARKAFAVKRMNKRLKQHILDILKQEVIDFSGYLNGECYGFIIRNTDTDEALDSCWGYYNADHLMQDAASALKQMEAITPHQLTLAI